MQRGICNSARTTIGAVVHRGHQELTHLSHTQRDRAQAVATCVEARRVVAQLGALELTDLAATAAYADIAD